MKDYEDRKYEQWRETTELVLPTLMKKSLLTKVRISGSLPRLGRWGQMMASAIFLRFGVWTGVSKIQGKEGARLPGEETEAASCRDEEMCRNPATPLTLWASG